MNETSLFPAKNEKTNYGLFGYEGAMCDRAISRDNPGMMEEAVRRGWISAESTTMSGKTILQLCEDRAPKCAEKLRELGVSGTYTGAGGAAP